MDQQSPQSVRKPVRIWLYGIFITLSVLILAVVLVVPRLIDSAAIKKKIQAAVTKQVGGQFDYQLLSVSYFPQLALELQQVTLSVPDQAQGTIEVLRLSPAIIPLFTGQLQLSRLDLVSPQFKLEQTDEKTKEVAAGPSTSVALEKSLAKPLEALHQVLPGLELWVNNGQLTIAKNTQKLVAVAGLSLQLSMSETDPHSIYAELQAKLSELTIYRNRPPETIKDISLRGSLAMMHNKMALKIDQLALAEPAIELAGDLTLAETAPGITLNVSGSNIDVDSTRNFALALAGDATPIKEIFDYLRGGLVPKISFSSHGESLSELGDLDNILIKGQLQNGKVSIPTLKIDLTEVGGDVAISKGILQGTHLSTRLDSSTGEDGSLALSLVNGNDLFQLDLLLDANLAETQPILQRLVVDQVFSQEMAKITNLKGTGRGRLILGDSLNNITAKLEASEVQLSANYQRVPWPITISQGRFTFNPKQIDLVKFSGAVGASNFADLSCQILWNNGLSFDISSGQLNLDMTELSPWLASLPGLGEHLKDVKRVAGQIDVSTLALKGMMDKPSDWQFALTGVVKDLSLDTEFLPDPINFTSGGFTVDTQQLVLEKLQTTCQDAELILSGSLKDYLQQSINIELSLDGQMGPQSVGWLSDAIKVPEGYKIRAPLSLNKVQVSWQPDSTWSFNGQVAIAKGPAVTADVGYHLKQLQVHNLTIKDQYSDASMVMDLRENQHDFKFSGKLQHETLQALFVDNQFNSGRLEGDLAVSVPQIGKAGITAKGQLSGNDLALSLPSGEPLNIEQVGLQADGSQVNVDITKLVLNGLTWEPVKAVVSFLHNKTNVQFAEAKLCGINSSGVVSFVGDEILLDFTLEGKNLDAASSYTCLTEAHSKATGLLDFSSHVTAEGKLNKLITNLRGPLSMAMSNGVVTQSKMLARTLEVINIAQVVQGRLPNLSSTGLGYSTMTLDGQFQNGKLLIYKYYMDGDTLDLVGKGEIGLEEKTVDVQLLASPFKTMDTVVKHLPGLNYLLDGTLVSIPINITGALAEPKVEVMPVAAVGSGLYNLAERTVKSPIQLLKTILPWGK